MMNIFLILWIFFNFEFRVYCWTANLSVKEEFQPNQVIGNIKYALPDKLKLSSLKFNVDSQFLHIKDNGDVTLKKRIDLETLCQISNICCGQILCSIQTNVLVNDKNDFIDSLTVNLQIDDLNDNTPLFSTIEQTITLRESLPVNYSMSLESAVDKDFSAENRIESYKLEDSSNKFELDTSKFPQISLRLKSELDYETRKQYRLTLKACDRDSCTGKELIIDVQDENDNKPIFTKSFYKVSLLENTDTGSLVVTVNAYDKDSGDLGKVTYSIDAPNDSDLMQTFGISPNSGEIRLERKLAANQRKLYAFHVVAKDSDFNNPQKEKVSVEITIEDINNYYPVITILSNNERVEVRENTPPGNLITIKVIDNDIDKNSEVHCELQSESKIDFQLLRKNENLYSLGSVRSFDFESGQVKSASIKCTDSGSPPKSTDRSVLVHVTDMNEYPPEFKQLIYEVSLRENTATNTKILQLNATDRDGAASIRYILDKKGNDYFKIDHMSGWIKTKNVVLDREVLETIVFNAYAHDAFVDPFTATTKIIVTIEDENDNAPVFGVIPEFTVKENMISTRLIGRLTATDADKGNNSQVEFVLLKTLARKQEVQKIFSVSKEGFIETLQSLDRETFESYTLEVGVRDKGKYPMATSTNVTVKVLDENDNKPQWMNPNPINPEYNITRIINKNELVMTVQAFDTDAGENGRIKYRILNPPPNSKKSVFSLDEDSGEIRLVKELDFDQIELTIIASDCATKPKMVTLKLLINNQSRVASSPSVSVIIILISVTGFISIVLVVSIICVRKRPIGTGIKYSCPNALDLGKTNMAEWTFQDNSIYKQKPGIHYQLNEYQLSTQNVASSRTSYEPIDAEESGDSGKGPSEDIRNGPYLDQNQIFARNYANMQWKIPSPIPSTACNGRQLYMLPDRSMNLHNSNYGSPYPSLMVSKPNNEAVNFNNPNPVNGVEINNLEFLSFSPYNANEFSLPRSPDYYQTSNSQSQIYETPDCFNSELDISHIQQSNI